jgi:hypothetical protein
MPRWSENSLCSFSHLSPLPMLFGTCFATEACFPFPPSRGREPSRVRLKPYGDMCAEQCSSSPTRGEDLTLSTDVHPRENRYRCVQMACRDVAWIFQMC